MPSKNPAQRLVDMLENARLIGRFTEGMSLAEFRRDLKTIYAVSRALEIISEASRRLPEDLKSRHSHVDWQGLAALGNVYRHDYDTVDETLIWEAIGRRLPALEDAVRSELKRLGLDID